MTPHPTRRRRHPGFVAACLAITLGAAACSSSSDDATAPATPTSPSTTSTGAPSPAPDPCALLTPAQIEAGTGWTVGQGVADDDAPDTAGSVCNWEDASAEDGVHLQFHEGDAATVFDERRRSLTGRGGAREPVDVEVDGTTDAFQVVAEGLLAMVVDDDYVQLSVIGGANEDDHLQLGADVARALR